VVTWGDADEVGSIRRRSFELHGARITVEASGPDAPAVVDAVWPSDARPIDGDEVDQVCTVEVAGHRRGDRSRVLVGGELVAEVADRDAVVDELASAIDFAVAEHATERVYLHAGVVAWGDRAIVVPGRSLSGKTTLVAALVRAGATYLSDEFAPIDREGRVWPHARPLSVRAEGTTGPGSPTPVAAIGGTAGTEPLPIGLVVHTRHVPGARWQPTELDDADGLLRLLDNAIVARTQPERALAFLAPVAAAARVLEGPRGDADVAAAQILLAATGPRGDEVPSLVAFTTRPGAGVGTARHLLIRMLLVARAASAPRATRSRRPVGLALAPLLATAVDGTPPGATAWSDLYDLPGLEGATGLLVRDLADALVAEPDAPWDRLDLVAPAPGRPSGEVWVPVPGTTPDDPRLPSPVRWRTSSTIEATCAPDAPELLDAITTGTDEPVGEVVVTGADRIGWGATYDSLEFWAVVRALRPAAAIAEEAERIRPRGPHLGVHWRRGSFAWAHPEASPSPVVAARQIASAALAHGLATVVLATDASTGERDALRRSLDATGIELELVDLGELVDPSFTDHRRQLVELTVLERSTWFLGTRGSSATAAVREARTASGRWAPDATWGVLCGDAHHPPDPSDPEHGPVWITGTDRR